MLHILCSILPGAFGPVSPRFPLRFPCVSVYRSPWGLLFIVFWQGRLLIDAHSHTHKDAGVHMQAIKRYSEGPVAELVSFLSIGFWFHGGSLGLQ